MSYDILFEPVKIGPLTAPNRFYASPHATGHGYSEPMGAIALRATKAEGGWGTVAVQITEVSEDTDMGSHPIERIWGDVYLDQHAKQAQAIKAHRALAAIELAHGGMRARNFITGAPVIGPSNLPILRAEIPLQARAMSKADIREFRHKHKQAALNAKRAGYDILYVYAAHDISLLSNFLSRRTNFRTDEYGGSLENRVRLLREVLQDTLEVAAGEQAVALRFSVHEPNEDPRTAMRYDQEGREVVEMLAELPDLWDVNLSGWPADSATARYSEEGHQLPFTSFVKEITSKPVVGVGRFTSPDAMVKAIKSGQLDLIGAARPSIADPFLPNKIRDNRIEDIRECIGCNICVSMDAYGVPLRCTQNPTIAEEWRRGWHPEKIPKAERQQSTLIVGGGPAGLECAWTLARAGHQVTLADAAEELGGRIITESALPGLSSWRRVCDYRVGQLRQCANVDLYTSSEIAAEDLAEFAADNIVIATGASWRSDGVGSSNFSPIKWPDGARVLSPDDIMAGVQPRGPVIVYDDEHFYMASALVDELCRQGHSVSYVTPLASVSQWTANTLEQGKIVGSMKEQGVSIRVNTRLSLFDGEKIAVQNTYSAEEELLPCGTLVVVGARTPHTELYDRAIEMLPSTNIVQTGDCLVPGIIQAAVFAGHRAARDLLEGEGAKFLLEKPADFGVGV